MARQYPDRAAEARKQLISLTFLGEDRPRRLRNPVDSRHFEGRVTAHVTGVAT